MAGYGYAPIRSRADASELTPPTSGKTTSKNPRANQIHRRIGSVRKNGSIFREFSKTSPRHSSSGGSGIRTHGSLRLAGFQDQYFRPLSHPSGPVVWHRSPRNRTCTDPIHRRRRPFAPSSVWRRGRGRGRRRGRGLNPRSTARHMPVLALKAGPIATSGGPCLGMGAVGTAAGHTRGSTTWRRGRDLNPRDP